MLCVAAILVCWVMTFSTYCGTKPSTIMGCIVENISDTVKMAAVEWSIEGIRYLREKEIASEKEGRNVGRESTVRNRKGFREDGAKDSRWDDG